MIKRVYKKDDIKLYDVVTENGIIRYDECSAVLLGVDIESAPADCIELNDIYFNNEVVVAQIFRFQVTLFKTVDEIISMDAYRLDDIYKYWESKDYIAVSYYDRKMQVTHRRDNLIDKEYIINKEGDILWSSGK